MLLIQIRKLRLREVICPTSSKTLIRDLNPHCFYSTIIPDCQAMLLKLKLAACSERVLQSTEQLVGSTHLAGSLKDILSCLQRE